MDSGCHKLSENIRFCGLRGHIVEIRRDVTLVTHGRPEYEDRARILETEFAINITLSDQPQKMNMWRSARSLKRSLLQMALCLSGTSRSRS